jgi:hypothetical protein
VTQILIRVIAVPQLDGGREHGAILDVGHQPSRLFPVAVHHDDFARTAARDERCDARRSDRTRADNPYLDLPLAFYPDRKAVFVRRCSLARERPAPFGVLIRARAIPSASPA